MFFATKSNDSINTMNKYQEKYAEHMTPSLAS